MAWFPIFRLGPSGGEVDFICKVIDIDISEGNIETEQRNLVGKNLKSYLRQNVPQITITFSQLTDAALAILRGFQSALSPLNFIYNSSLAVKYLMATSASTTSIVIPPTSATGITITGVFLQSDTAQSGTNYFSGGSTFDSTTGTLTLATPLPGANTDVWINYNFTGLSCWVRVSPKPHQGVYKNFWQGTITLSGS